MRSLQNLLAVAVLGLLLGCQSGQVRQHRSTFLVTADPVWNAWLEEKVDIDVHHFPLWRFRQLPAFRAGNYFLDGQTAGGKLVELKAENISRREVFWRIHKQTGLIIDLYSYHGTKVVRFRSRKVIELKGY